jgi:hypothetical protein
LRCHIEELAAQRELLGAMAVRKQSIIANPMEAVGQNVKEEAADEFTHFSVMTLLLSPVLFLQRKLTVLPFILSNRSLVIATRCV